MFSVMKKLSWYFKEQWVRYTLAIVAIIVSSILFALPPMIVGDVIDGIQSNQLTSEKLMHAIWLFIGLLVIIYLLSIYWGHTLFGRAILLERKMRSRLMNHFMKMTPTFYGRYRTGDLMARSTNDLRAVAATAGFGILTLIDSTVFMAFIIGIMFIIIDWKLTLATLLPLPIMAYIMQKYGAKIHERFMEAQALFSDLNNNTLESIQGVRVIRAFVQEKQDEQRFNDKAEEVFQKNIAVARLDALFEPTIKILVGVSYTIGLGYGSYLIINGDITMGQLVSFNIYLGMLIWPMFAVGELINVMQRGNASLDRIQNVLRQKADVKDPEYPAEVVKPETISFRNLTFEYPTADKPSLRNINLEIKSGETIGVVGLTGAGKTTLVKQLLKEYPAADQGELVISGAAIQDIPLRKTRNWIGYVPQDHILFSKTVKENILFGNPNATDEEVYQILERTALRNDIENLPAGLETMVGESGVTLSGGQKQRVSLARALIRDPEILILDDSLSAVDGKTEANIIDHLKQERAGKTTIIVAHRLSAVTHADQIIVLEDGEIQEHGTHQMLMQERGWYYHQFLIQQMEEGE
ncbi:ABC transporter ATP-binding protein [Gracilibacillus alcaliphilus]|uniref:ABC transporter ATP-binding protein n=1 Tax=Gracilibacillus alcaliphilus TaxID=1401441 RepID=UPI00195EC226|nr:ABC transporter transmembrane domain-containing protein [Gracilibacillus alcaliphilus]MBM7676534.1 ATP-binding cassette subfamily B protein [Gracilibacillus alcaliphilus]